MRGATTTRDRPAGRTDCERRRAGCLQLGDRETKVVHQDRHVEVEAYELKMNVTPNAVATKE